jgi:hypothetical protein
LAVYADCDTAFNARTATVRPANVQLADVRIFFGLSKSEP